MQHITEKLHLFWRSKYNWTLVVLTLFLYYILSSTYSSNSNYDMVKDLYHYFIFANIGILVALIIRNTEKTSHLVSFAGVSLLIEVITILSLKSYAVPGFFSILLVPVSIFAFLCLLKETVLSVAK